MNKSMGRQPNIGTPIAFGLILAALIIGYFDYSTESNESASKRTIAVTGKASKIVKADEAVWKGWMVNEASSLQRGYLSVKQDRELLEEFLKEKGIDSSRIEYGSLNLQGHSNAGRTSRYTLEQPFSVRGNDPERIQRASREAASLMEKGVRIESEAPHFHYSDLRDLQTKLGALALKNAEKNARAMADSSGLELGILKRSQEDLFQVEGTDPEGGSAPGHSLTRSLSQRIEVRVNAEYSIE